MDYLEILIKLVVGLSILNVWLLRSGKATQWRGGDAKNITEEFAAYGLSKTFMIILGTVKVGLAILLIISIWFSSLEIFASYGIAALMAGAVSMHFKVGDPPKKSLPAFTFLILSLIIALI
jgi:hypothetical protein